jgi:adenylate kinase
LTVRNIVILLGPPGAGKGTQARVMMDKLDLPQIATGDMLRDAVTEKTRLGMEAKKVLDAGNLVGDDIVAAIVLDRTSAPDCARGFILDGYPRNLAQAKLFQAELRAEDHLTVIGLAVETDFLVKRITSRITCRQCSAVYNSEARAPRVGGVCDRCGGDLIHRSDDHEEVVWERLRTFSAQAELLAEFYRSKGVYSKVDGMSDIGRVTEDIMLVIRGVAGTA